ncbi:MAG: FAD-binding oxidoreductase [Chloroflexota bacterium]|nr:FAD-binding oxidoreductase [Chloroflexota bacterium]
MSLIEKVDVVIIGAGIIGASCAFHLGEQGVKVAVLEAQIAPAMGSTARSAAGVRVQFTEEANIRISWESIQQYQHFAELYGDDAEYHPNGYLLLVPPERWAAHLASVRLQQQIGVPVNVLTAEEAQSIVQFDPSNIAGTTHGPADGVIDPHRVTLTYLRLAKERGVSSYMDTPMISAKRVGNVWQVETPIGAFEAEYLVNAAGSWAGEVAKCAGLEVPIQPSKRMVYVTSPTSWQHRYPTTIDLASGFYLRSEGRRILFGRSNPNELPGFTEGVDWNWFEQTLSVGLERFPWLEEAGLDRRACWWGYYEITPDHNPILGRMPGIENWINAAGFSGHGVQQAPAVGRLIAEEILQGKAQSINIDPLRIERFSSEQHERELNII